MDDIGTTPKESWHLIRFHAAPDARWWKVTGAVHLDPGEMALATNYTNDHESKTIQQTFVQIRAIRGQLKSIMAYTDLNVRGT